LDAGVDASKNPPFWTDATKIREEPFILATFPGPAGDGVVSAADTVWESSCQTFPKPSVSKPGEPLETLRP